MDFCELFTTPITAEELLEKKRAETKDAFDATLAALKKQYENERLRASLVDRAEYARKNLFILPGSDGKPIDVGEPPAWNTLRYPDPEYIWFLNRMPGLSDLMNAYLVTGDEIYGKKAIVNVMSWIHDCPLPLDPEGADRDAIFKTYRAPQNGWRTLEVGLRAFGPFPEFFKKMLFSDLVTPEVFAAFVKSLWEHARVLYLTTPMMWPKADHNHYLHEMLGLLVIAGLLPELRDADTWRTFAVGELVRCAEAQITEEGGQVEGNPHYHWLCLDMFLSVIRLFRELHVEVPKILMDRVRAAARYTACCFKPSGTLSTIGDSPFTTNELHRVITAYYNTMGSFDGFADALPLFTLPTPCPIPKDAIAAAIAEHKDAGADLNHQKWLGQVMARTGWKKDDSWFHLVCKSPVVNGHSHQEAMSFQLSLLGDDLVIDPSYYKYTDCPKRLMYRSAEYHSTLTMGERRPSEITGIWGFGPQKEGQVKGAYKSEGVLAADAYFNAYEPNEHRRLVALVDRDTFICADDVINQTGDSVEIYLHFLDTTFRPTAFGAESDRVRVLLPEGERQILPSTYSPHLDAEAPSTRLRYQDKSGEKAPVYLTVITKNATVTNPAATRAEDGIRLSFDRDGKTVSLLWKYGESCRKI